MKRFEQREIHAAYAHAATGGQALHLMDGSFAHLQKRTPNCFKGRRVIAHLFDQDAVRLAATVRRLGVRVVLIEHPGSPRQHVDLCGKPLERALAKCAEPPAAECPECRGVSSLPELFDVAVVRGLAQCPKCEIGSPATEWRAP